MRPCFLALLLVACAPGQPGTAADAELAWNDLDTGKSCVAGKVACGVGNCAARIHNGCKSAVTCSLTVQSICAAYTGETGEALGRSEETIAPGDDDGILARVLCAQADVKTTQATALSCR